MFLSIFRSPVELNVSLEFRRTIETVNLRGSPPENLEEVPRTWEGEGHWRSEILNASDIDYWVLREEVPRIWEGEGAWRSPGCAAEIDALTELAPGVPAETRRT